MAMKLEELLKLLPVLDTRQDSVEIQMIDLEIIARQLGMTEAAKVIQDMLKTNELSGARMGCHVDLESMEEDFEPDGCVIDDGDITQCIYARDGMRKEECEYWRPFWPRQGNRTE